MEIKNEYEIQETLKLLENLGDCLEKLNVTEEQETFFAVGYMACYEFFKRKKISNSDLEENPHPSVYGC
jgi:hypothetical protein